MNPRGTCYPCPGGEDHLKRRSSSPPVPPLLGCRHCPSVPRPNRASPRRVSERHLNPASQEAKPPRRGQGRQVEPVPRGFSPGDARGEAPCIRKLKISPFPVGEGGRGDRGQERKLKAGLAGDKEGKPPVGYRNATSTPPRKRQSPPPGTGTAGRASAASPQPRGCKGRSPLHKIT